MIDMSLLFYVPRFLVGSNQNVFPSLTLSSKYSHIWLHDGWCYGEFTFASNSDN